MAEPKRRVYILESSWAWDHSNTEIATICEEEYEEGHIEKHIADGDAFAIKELCAIARSQNGNFMGSTDGNIKRLFLVENVECISLSEANNFRLPTMKLRLLFEFRGNAVIDRRNDQARKKRRATKRNK